MMCGIGPEATSALSSVNVDQFPRLHTTQEGLDRSVHQVQRPSSLLKFFHVESNSIDLISISNLDSDRSFFTCRKHRFIELANLQIPKNLDLSKSSNRKKVIEPSIANHEKNIGCPPLLNCPSLRSGQFKGSKKSWPPQNVPRNGS
jgi:hypothetical protein